MDPRFIALTQKMVGYSTKVREGDLVILRSTVDVPEDMLFAVIQEVKKEGASVIPWMENIRINAEVYKGCKKRQLRSWAVSHHALLTAIDVVITFRAFSNMYELGGVPSEDLKLVDNIYVDLIKEELIDRSRWVLTRWPTPANSQLAEMSTTEYEDFFFDAVLADYGAMARAVRPLVKLMDQTNKVRITGPGTDLSFSIKGIPVVPCVGERNLPDGEVFTAPVRESVEGKIVFNTVTVNKNGQKFSGVSLVFKKGKIIEATCQSGSVEKLNNYLDTDEGGRFVGEFSLGINPSITKTIGETLFDEKVGGSIHLTPGTCYDDASNDNKSSIHWDIVLDQRKEMGGGKIYFDGKLIRKDGLFVPKNLMALTPKIEIFGHKTHCFLRAVGFLI